MIESRYKIEYVLPDEEIKKSSPFKVMWYLLLIPLILFVVMAITYDFSFANLSRDSLTLVEKAKVQLFNLGDKQQLETQTPIITKEAVSNGILKKITKKPIIVKPVINQDKITITELTAKQEQQLAAIKKQISENAVLTQELNNLSEQFVLEQVKNQGLSTQLTEQEKDRLELEEQLNKILEESANNQISLESLESPLKNKEAEAEITPITIQKLTVSETPKTILPPVVEVVEVAPDVKTIPVAEMKPTPEEIIPQQSETDKIIEAMTAIESSKIKIINGDAAVEEKNETLKPETKPTTEDANQTKEIANNETEIESKELLAVPEPILTTKEEEPSDTVISKEQVTDPIKVSQESVKVTDTTKVEQEPVKVTEAIKIESKDSTIDSKVDEVKEAETAPQVTEKPSAVDAIIAAMQDSQSNTESSKTTTKGPIVDTKLEKIEKVTN